MIRIYYSDLSTDVDTHYLIDQLNYFPSFIQKRLNKFKRAQDRHASILGKLILIELGRTFGIHSNVLEDIQYTAYNKPYLTNRLNFNISHSGKYVMCAASDTVKLGLDIEEIKPIEIQDFRSQFSDQEWNDIVNDRDVINKFYEYWTKKEAIVKAEGKGLSIPLINICLSCPYPFQGEDLTRWTIQQIIIDSHYKSALAIPEFSANTQIELIHFSFLNSTKEILITG